jgi:hypothetical protein
MGAWDDAGPELAVALGGAGGGTIASSQDDEYRQVVLRTLSSQDDEYRQVVFRILKQKIEKYTLCRTMFALPG